MRYKSDDYIPTDVLCSRAHELVNAIITNGGRCPREFTMRIPAERDRDADLVISEIARRLQKTEVERNALLAELAQIAKLIHYPDCWDIAAYPTLLDTLNNTMDFNCVTCWAEKQNEKGG